MRKFLMIALGLTSLGAFTHVPSALAETKSCSGDASRCSSKCKGGICEAKCEATFKACVDKAYSDNLKNRNKYGRDDSPFKPGRGTKTGDKSKGGVVADDPNKGWNGQYTKVVVTDGAGTHTYTVKQGVPIENGQMILAPNGASYHVWDPELARQLKAAGVNAAYANPATAKNEYALGRDKVVRDRAIAAGQSVPQPTGHRNRDALGNAAPVVNDHRKGTATEAKPGSPPPAAPIGTVSTTPPPTNGTQPAVRDHRKASGSGGGVTVTQTQKAAGGSGAGSSRNGSTDRKRQ
jgi:hypothetical protein